MKFDRRNMVKIMGALSASPSILGSVYAENIPTRKSPASSNDVAPIQKAVTCIVLGAGNRGNIYSSYSKLFPGEMKIVGVAEPIKIRNQRFAKEYGIPDAARFATWEDVFKVKKFADAILITTPDDLHYAPAMKALEMGYDIQLEKPIAPTWEECDSIRKQAHRYGRIVAVCHVLRYSPYFRKMKAVTESGVLGALISVQHLEPVYYEHIAHSYVRGNWRRAEDGNPMILAKSCHDLDILRWIIDQPCNYVSSFGSLTWFQEKNAPPGSTARCTDGCAIEPECPYSALKIYYRNRRFCHHFDLPEEKSKQGEAILRYLKESNYGKCVYRSDNDVVDHQIVAMEFEGPTTVNFSMEGMTSYAGRRTRLFGSMGDAVGDEEALVVADFRTGKIEKWLASEHKVMESGHGGGDFGLVHDFLRAVSHQNPALLTSTIDVSMDSHQIGFMAEKSRLTKTTIKI